MGSKLLADAYSAFDEYDHAYDTQYLAEDSAFIEAVARSRHGRRPGSRVATRAASAARVPGESVRPMTAVRAAGYSSYASRVEAEEARTTKEKKDDSMETRLAEMEENASGILKESAIASAAGNHRQALERAKEAMRRNHAILKMRDENNKLDDFNADLSLSILLNQATQFEANDMTTEALNTYQIILEEKKLGNVGRFKMNIGNIHFKRKEYVKAIKFYRQALDQIPSVQKSYRNAVLKNIGLTFIKLARYEEAALTFEQCVEERAENTAAFNLVLAMYCLEDGEKMRDSFVRLLEIGFPDDDKATKGGDMLKQLASEDSLSQYLRGKKLAMERAILIAARVIAPAITDESSSGHEWCIEMMKQSPYAYLASELEMSKAVHLMREGKLEEARVALNAFSSSMPKTRAASAANMAVMEWMKGPSGREDARRLVHTAISLDRYNTAAHVMAGILSLDEGDLAHAVVSMQEALDNDASCVQALYNLGLIHKRAHRVEAALESFYKLNSMLRNNVQVLCQLASIYEFMEDSGQALELYSQANSLAPSDAAILSRLAAIYDNEGDKTQAFQCLYDSYRYLPSNMAVVQWIAGYYLDAQFAEKAVAYFERAAIMQPQELKWQMMMASCHRRAGDYHKAFDLYKSIHNKFPSNIECLKFLVRIATDLGMPEAAEYSGRLQKAEKVRQLRQQRETDSAHGKAGSATSAQSLPIPLSDSLSPSSPTLTDERPHSHSLNDRLLSAQVNLEEPYRSGKRDMNMSYSDPLGRVERPKTGVRRGAKEREDSFDDLDESFLPV